MYLTSVRPSVSHRFTFGPGTDTAYSRVRLNEFDDEEMQSIIGSEEHHSEFGLDALT
jgi:hypothetical protein